MKQTGEFAGYEEYKEPEEFGLGEEGALVAGAILHEDDTAGKNVIAFHAYMQKIPEEVSKAAKSLMEEMQNGFPVTKKYCGELYASAKVALNPKTLADNAVGAFRSMKSSFGEMYNYAKTDMGKDLFAKLSSFVKAVKDNFSKFVDMAKTKMTPAYEKANEAFSAMYDKAASVTKPARDAVGESAAYKKAKEVGAKVAESTKEYGDKVYKAVSKKPSKDSGIERL